MKKNLIRAISRDLDIESLAYAWAMYFNHKDYSVYAIDTSLIVFEKKN